MSAVPSPAPVGANAITETSANLIGTINPNSAATTYHFAWGPTSSLGTSTATGSAGSGSVPVTVTAEITGLTAGTEYFYAVVATNTNGTVTSYQLTFNALPVPTVTQANTPFIPYGAPDVSIPHFAYPLVITTAGALVVQQDSIDDTFGQVQAVMACDIGEWPENAPFGRPDPTFSQAPLTGLDLVDAIQQWVPDAEEDVVIAAMTDDGVAGITLTTSTAATAAV